jgi:fructoselysine-6-P-deglycase FrlB-like protein
MEPFVTEEIASQPRLWERMGLASGPPAGDLPSPGERVAIVGCGTSWHIARSYAALREASGHGETDAFAASEAPLGRAYDRVVGLSRSGTTTEVVDLLRRIQGVVPTVAITAVNSSPITEVVDATISLDMADERSVVQTRFASTALAFLRHHLGQDLSAAIADAEEALASELPAALLSAEQITVLGTGWTYGLAEEAALKLRETAGAWAEAYPSMEYRHGPISIATIGRAVWMFGEAPPGLVDDIRNTGASLVLGALDPMAELIRAQRLGVELAQQRGLDPDRPRHLTRSVILPSA